MTDAAAFIENFLAHRDPDYDPVKRREYYLRNRELKGRQKGKQSDLPKNTYTRPVVQRNANGLTADQVKRGNALFKDSAPLLKTADRLSAARDAIDAKQGLTPKQKEVQLARLDKLEKALYNSPQMDKFVKRLEKDPSLLKYLDVAGAQRDMKYAAKLIKAANSRSSTDKKRMTP